MDQQLSHCREAWCEFHRTYGHDTKNCYVLTVQLAWLAGNDTLQRLQELGERKHVTPMGGVTPGSSRTKPQFSENTIAWGFSRGSITSSSRKRYARSILSLEAWRPPQALLICFLVTDLDDVAPREYDPTVILVIAMGCNVPRVLVDQGSSTNIMFWETMMQWCEIEENKAKITNNLRDKHESIKSLELHILLVALCLWFFIFSSVRWEPKKDPHWTRT